MLFYFISDTLPMEGEKPNSGTGTGRGDPRDVEKGNGALNGLDFKRDDVGRDVAGRG